MDGSNVDGPAKVSRRRCGLCGTDVLLAKTENGTLEYYETGHTRMLVVLSFPEIDGKKRVALGPCWEKHGDELHAKDDEPTVYFAHVKHRCPPAPQFSAMKK